MIEEMRIRDLGVIAEAVVEFAPGLTVLTGETGAGKTMVLTGLSLLCGGRADPTRVRSGCPRAVVEGRIRLPAGHRAESEALEAGAELDEDGSLLVVRIVGADGRSRAVVGGRSVPSGLLARMMADVVAVHGQSAQSGLLRPSAAREALDRYAGLSGPTGDGTFERYVETYRLWRATVADIEDRVVRCRERAREADLLRLGLEEIEKVSPAPGEADALTAEADVLSHADELRCAARQAGLALTGEDDVDGPRDALSGLVAAHRALAGVAAHDQILGELSGRLHELAGLAADLAADLASYAARVEVDPERLAAVEDRRARIRHLTRRYGETVEDVLGWAENARARLTDLDDSEEALAELQRERDRLSLATADLAQQLHVRRVSAASGLAGAVAEELVGLSLGSARLDVSVRVRGPVAEGIPQPRDAIDPPDGAEAAAGHDLRVMRVAGAAAQAGPDGVDDVSFLLSPHDGAPARPVSKVASGGELSRIMLALEVAFAGVTRTPVLVFDEVDAGVGGAVAIEVGRRLALLARRHQVVTVTHLAQVAAFADRHLTVTKEVDDSVTTSDVRRMDGEARVAEIARMLGGLSESGSGRRHAEELLARATGGQSDG